MGIEISPAAPLEGTNFKAIVTIKNTGNEASVPFEVHATDNGADAGTMPSPAIQSNSQQQVTFNFIASSDGQFSNLAFTIPAYPATLPVGQVNSGLVNRR